MKSRKNEKPSILKTVESLKRPAIAPISDKHPSRSAFEMKTQILRNDPIELLPGRRFYPAKAKACSLRRTPHSGHARKHIWAGKV